MENNYIFVMEFNDDKIRAGRKEEIDSEIKYYEESNTELPFKIIGKIKEPQSVGFSENLIEWYEGKPETRIIHHAVIAIINLMQYGR